MRIRKYLKQVLIFCFVFFLIYFFSFNKIFAQEFSWNEVARSSNEIQFIDSHSIQYNNQGVLTFFTRHFEINPVDQNIISTDSYLMAVDCENRLFSRLPRNGELKQIKTWNKSTNDKFIKTIIINSCSY